MGCCCAEVAGRAGQRPVAAVAALRRRQRVRDAKSAAGALRRPDLGAR